MALTTAQISEIRLLSGDDCTGEYVVTDDQLNLWYDDVASTCYVIVKVLQARLAVASKTSGVSPQGQPVTSPQFQQIESQIKYWRMQCVDALPTVTTGEISLGIDEEDTEYTNP